MESSLPPFSPSGTLKNGENTSLHLQPLQQLHQLQQLQQQRQQQRQQRQQHQQQRQQHQQQHQYQQHQQQQPVPPALPVYPPQNRIFDFAPQAQTYSQAYSGSHNNNPQGYYGQGSYEGFPAFQTPQAPANQADIFSQPPQQQQASNELVLRPHGQDKILYSSQLTNQQWLSAFGGLGTGITGSPVLPASTFTPIVVPPPFNEYANDFITSATLGRNTSPFNEYADDFITSATLGRNTSPFDEYADDFITSATLGRNTSPFNEYADDFITSATLGRNTSNSNDIFMSTDRSGSPGFPTSTFTPLARPTNIPPGFPFARQPIGEEVFQLCPNCGERKHASKKAWRVCQEPCWRCGKKHETEVPNGKLTVRCPRNKTYPGYEPPGNKNKPEHWTLSATIRNAKKDGRLLEDPETGLFYEPKSPYNNVDPNAVESNDVTSRVNSETDDRQQKRPRLQSNASHSSSPHINLPSMGLQLNTAPRPFMGQQLNTALRPSMGLQLNAAPYPSMGPQNTTASRPREPSSSRREVLTSRPLPRQAMNPDVGLYILTRAQYEELLDRITCLEDANHLEHVRLNWQPMAIAIGRQLTHTTRQGSKGLEVLEYDFYTNTGGWVLVPQ